MSYLDQLFSLKGQTALITGGTRGIGAQMALALSKAGADLILVQRNHSNLSTKEAIEKAGGRADVVICDLASKAEVGGLIAKITVEMGRTLDIVVNCGMLLDLHGDSLLNDQTGGIQRRTPAENFPDADWDEVLQVNLSTVFTISRDAGKHMLASRGGVSGETAPEGGVAGNPRGHGKIINVSSLVAYQGGLTVPAYAAAKHGVAGIVKAFSNEWSSKGINVNAIAPGYIATDMNEALIGNPTRAKQILERIPAGRWGSPADFEGAIVFLASRASDYVSGETLVVDGGWMGR
ncbi:hypothetical protein P7C73_g2239, partial [Tremellales sp. Uapishka_1]